jgi:hypothetical protein
MVLQQMTDHQTAIALLREAAEMLSLDELERQRLFDKNMLAGFERGMRQGRVMHRRSSNRHRRDRRVSEDMIQTADRGVEAFR